VEFEVLHPSATALASATPATRANTLSCVLRVQGGGVSVLLTGDIEAAQEATLVREAASRLPSTVLWVPHHGSRTSSTADFIAAVAPQVAGVPVVSTARCGAWRLASEGPSMACMRSERRRYWHHPGP
jgi:competence protein ComEC